MNGKLVDDKNTGVTTLKDKNLRKEIEQRKAKLKEASKVIESTSAVLSETQPRRRSKGGDNNSKVSKNISSSSSETLKQEIKARIVRERGSTTSTTSSSSTSSTSNTSNTSNTNDNKTKNAAKARLSMSSTSSAGTTSNKRDSNEKRGEKNENSSTARKGRVSVGSTKSITSASDNRNKDTKKTNSANDTTEMRNNKKPNTSHIVQSKPNRPQIKTEEKLKSDTSKHNTVSFFLMLSVLTINLLPLLN